MGRMICPGDSTGKAFSTVLGPSSGTVQEKISRPSWVRPVGEYRKTFLDRPGSVQWDSTGKDVSTVLGPSSGTVQEKISTVLGPSSGTVQEKISRPSWVSPVGQYRKRSLDRPGSVQWDSTGKALDRPGSVQWDSTGKDFSTVLGRS